ncbi:Tripartite tricarboxylate transporter TctB family protein [Labrenzia sp. THAF191b]|uniref:tripartite tricarboxylate transporter TctB family protein n=1 Tax=unclassified Labrenzia TaxID=2648686 RepID=UPI001267F703|nr:MULTISPECIES: tripartite tricarboxylate transporter TctB family protein [unclassified Labrenzia]QFS96319.1 Tripartite tricarboxylate transporter TctB family protein [Labrenzia sp. THAF191b]QFT02634.1 Tripartite tricarboxylate transporter TctB family protein [Labrenzia sp. THAF191a]QFT14176.1 Tripartite tricarboxylate transporter TctB family protein [Labrenzia sp. THAF187b]
MSDRILGGVGVCLAAFYIWAATIIPKSFMADVIGPSTFPIIIGVILAVCSTVFILKPDPAPDWPSAGPLLEIAFAVAVMLAYAHLLPELGFVISTAIATTYLTWRLGSKPLNSVVIGVATSIGIYVVFRLILGLSLAKGPLGF